MVKRYMVARMVFERKLTNNDIYVTACNDALKQQFCLYTVKNMEDRNLIPSYVGINLSSRES
jgi:hypothetical protein